MAGAARSMRWDNLQGALRQELVNSGHSTGYSELGLSFGLGETPVLPLIGDNLWVIIMEVDAESAVSDLEVADAERRRPDDHRPAG